MLQLISRVVPRIRARRLAFEANSVSVAFRDQLAGELPKVALGSTSGVVEELRQIKDRWEVQEIRRSVDLAQRAFAVVRAALRPEQNRSVYRFPRLADRAFRFGELSAGDTALRWR